MSAEAGGAAGAGAVAGASARTWLLVLNYQGRDHLGRCLESAAGQEEPPGGAHLLVLDNASTDGSWELLERRFPELDRLRNEDNLGFAGGNNVGIRRALEAGAEYVALLNPDTTVEPSWLRHLVAAADRHPDAGLLGARIYDRDGQLVEFDGRSFDPVTTSGGYADRKPEARDADGSVDEAAYACGAGMLMRAAVLARIGLFDETFFAYHEDVELALRCWRHGHRVLNVAAAKVHHVRGASGSDGSLRDFLGSRNLVLTLLKHYDVASVFSHGASLLSLLTEADGRHRVESLYSALFRAPDALRRRRELGESSEADYGKVRRRLGRLR